ncbi:MAG TPA: hypothetical protein VKB71_14355 [Rhizomicrobium sp.]|nr:hypothetical protein [Rhizomicrobium sp.]
MKSILLAGAALLAMAGVAQADPYAAMYGNTVTITGSDGMKLVTYVNQDMTWEQHNANGTVMKGTYAWKDATTACFTTTDPAPKTPSQTPMCLPNQVAHNVGDSWTVAGGDGKPVTVAISAGR